MIKPTSIAHYFGGVLVAFLTPFNVAISVLITALFVIYELNEDWYLSDEAFIDIREFLIGLILGGILLVGQVLSYRY